jgi:hypothetical protein
VTMRSNGLRASAYSPVADLDPRVADALLTDLKDQGVAAYTKPVESTTTSGFDRPEFRVSVLDRLYVDAAAAERVSELLSAQDPELVTSNEDLTWAQIVAGFDRPIADDVHPWPATEDLTGPSVSKAAMRTDDAGGPAPSAREDDALDDGGGDLRRWLARRDATSPRFDRDDADVHRETGDYAPDLTGNASDDADRFIPPPPPPLPKLEPYQQLAWVGLVGGPVLLLVSVLFSIALPVWMSMATVIAFIGGFVTLVATMEDRIDPDDDSDNGAVV